jgi:CRISPR/Cas system-associated endoribonuclease Cas2
MKSKIITQSHIKLFQRCQRAFWLKTKKRKISHVNGKIEQIIQGNNDALLTYLAKTNEYSNVPIINQENGKSPLQKSIEYIAKKHSFLNGVISHKNIEFQIDGLIWNNGWTLIKMANSTRINRNAYNDIALIVHALIHHKVNLDSVIIYAINPEESANDNPKLNDAFIKKTVTRQVLELLPKAERKIHRINNVLSAKNKPQVSYSSHCLKPEKCEFHDKCWGKDYGASLLQLSGLPLKEKVTMLQQQKDKPESIKPANEWDHIQKVQILCDKYNIAHVNAHEATAFANALKFPIQCIDIESFQSPVPQYGYTKPFEQIPVLYSIQRLNAPGKKEDTLAFVADLNHPPHQQIADSLLDLLDPKGSILTYDAEMEKKFFREFAKFSRTHARFFKHTIDSISDLFPLFSSRKIYTPLSQGKNRLKAVIKGISLNNPYENSEIKSGEEAVLALLNSNNETKEQIINEILDYCHIDTKAILDIAAWLLQFKST